LLPSLFLPESRNLNPVIRIWCFTVTDWFLNVLNLKTWFVLFWHSSWAHSRPLSARFPLLYGHSRRKNRTVQDALHNGAWIKDIAYNLNNDLLAEFFRLWNVLQSLELNLDTPEEDQICWKLDTSEKYTAKSAYSIQFSGSILSNFPKLIWKAWAPPKCKFLLWLLLQDRLWTATRLQVRGWENNYFCGLCIRNLETALHLFVECPLSRAHLGACSYLE
jgi:hypothetical protein